MPTFGSQRSFSSMLRLLLVKQLDTSLTLRSPTVEGSGWGGLVRRLVAPTYSLKSGRQKFLKADTEQKGTGGEIEQRRINRELKNRESITDRVVLKAVVEEDHHILR